MQNKKERKKKKSFGVDWWLDIHVPISFKLNMKTDTNESLVYYHALGLAHVYSCVRVFGTLHVYMDICMRTHVYWCVGLLASKLVQKLFHLNNEHICIIKNPLTGLSVNISIDE